MPKINVNDIELVYDEEVPIHIWRISIITGVLPSKDSVIGGAIVRFAKSNAILKCPVNKLFTVENTYYETIQIDKTREQKLRWEAAVIGDQNRKYYYQLLEHWEGGSLNMTNINVLIIF